MDKELQEIFSSLQKSGVISQTDKTEETKAFADKRAESSPFCKSSSAGGGIASSNPRHLLELLKELPLPI